MPTFRLLLEYDGSAFEGWQVQPDGRRTVQGALADAFRQATGQQVRVVGAGRTDAGVHAEGQVASASVETALAPERLRRALDAALPPDVAVLECRLAPEGFDARRDARAKVYRYSIWNGPCRSPLRAARSCWVRAPLDLAAMRQASADCVGRHDFAALRSAGSDVRSTTRTLTRLDVEGEPRGEVFLHVEGDGFLRHMVRALAGTLIEVGLGRRAPDSMPALLAARERGRAGPTAPPQGLCLVRVLYAFP